MASWLGTINAHNRFGAEHKVLDVGSFRGDAYRRMVEQLGWEYTGLDLVFGTNVDVVASKPYRYDFEDEAFDVVLSGSTMEHVQNLDMWVQELARLVRPAGWLLILTVNEWPEHKHPIDCWRILPDGMRWLLSRAFRLHHCKVGMEGRDTWGVARKRVDWLDIRGRDLLPAERHWLVNYAGEMEQRVEKPVIVNIGVRYGASMYCLRRGSKDARLIGIDIDMSQLWEGPELDAVLIESDSRECHGMVDIPVHFLFIDSDHHREVIEVEIKRYVPKVAVGGIVAFHDYNPKPGVAKILPHLADVKAVVDEWVYDPSATDVWVQIEAPESLAAWRRIE